MDLTGQTLGHYRVLEEISRGGMGIVYRATDARYRRFVGYWKDGDLDRDRVEEAQRKIGS